MNENDQIKLSLTFEASFCNQWPELEITANDHVIWKGFVEGTQQLILKFVGLDKNHIVLKYLNKQNGPDLWDTTIDDSGNILQDQHCILKQILINDANCEWLISEMPYHYNDGTCKNNFGYMDLKGYMKFNFPMNVYRWILDHRQSIKPSNSRNSSLDYKNIYIPQNENAQLTTVINEIKKLLKRSND